MSSLEVILVLGLPPLVVMIVLGLLTLRPHFRRAPSYHPGQEWKHPPVWWTASVSLDHQHAPRQREPGTGTAHGGASGDW